MYLRRMSRLELYEYKCSPFSDVSIHNPSYLLYSIDHNVVYIDTSVDSI